MSAPAVIRSLLAGCLFAGWASACISEARVDDGGDTVSDSGATDTGDTSGGPDATPECDSDGDCVGDPGVCRAWRCVAGTCSARIARDTDCDDGNPCTGDDRCDASGVCEGAPADDGEGCDSDGLACTGTGICDGGLCVELQPPLCPQPAAACRVAVCAEPNATCEEAQAPAGEPCVRVDGSDGQCSRGICVPNGMIWIPQGTFVMGCERSLRCAADASPQHVVQLSGYAIGRTELRSDLYQDCVLSGACAPTRVDESTMEPETGVLPARNLTWDMAEDACKHYGLRLCTEAEWEKAARGTDQRVYPWGSQPGPDCSLATLFAGGFLVPGCGANGPRAVGAAPDGASPVGALDMSGNVREWVADAYVAEAYDGRDEGDAPIEDPLVELENTGADAQRVLRGGAFNNGSASDLLRTTARSSASAISELRTTGTRCCWSP